MITEIAIENFKCFQSLKIENLSRFTLIGGDDNIGKTCLLEAIHTLFKRLYPSTFGPDGLRIIPGHIIEAKDIWAPFFHNFEIESDKAITIRTTGDNDTKTHIQIKYGTNYTPKGSFWPPKGSNSPFPDSGNLSNLHFQYETNDTANLFFRPDFGPTFDLTENDAIPAPPSPSEFLSNHSRPLPDSEAKTYSNLDKTGQTSLVLQMLKQVDSRIEALSISFSNGVPLIHAKVDGIPCKIPVNQMGSGASHVLSLALALSKAQGGLLLVDEIDNSLHYSVQEATCKTLARGIQDANCQLIATTHSYEFLQKTVQGLKEKYSNDFSYIRLDRIGDKIVPKYFDLEMLENAFELGLEVR